MATGRGPRAASRGPRAARRGTKPAGRGPRAAGREPRAAGRGPRDAGRGPRAAGRGPRAAGRGPLGRGGARPCENSTIMWLRGRVCAGTYMLWGCLLILPVWRRNLRFYMINSVDICSTGHFVRIVSM